MPLLRPLSSSCLFSFSVSSLAKTRACSKEIPKNSIPITFFSSHVKEQKTSFWEEASFFFTFKTNLSLPKEAQQNNANNVSKTLTHLFTQV
jgi:hypothetical protein